MFMKNCCNTNSSKKKIFQSPINRVNQYINYENNKKNPEEKMY